MMPHQILAKLDAAALQHPVFVKDMASTSDAYGRCAPIYERLHELRLRPSCR